MAKSPNAAESPVPSFDQRLQRLEALVAELEQGGLALETSIERYQEGVGLLRECRTTLLALEKRVEELTAQGGLEAFPGDPDAADRSGRAAGGGRG